MCVYVYTDVHVWVYACVYVSIYNIIHVYTVVVNYA